MKLLKRYLLPCVIYFLSISRLNAIETTCVQHPCLHGKCIDLSNSITKWSKYLCECEPEWDGVNCNKKRITIEADELAQENNLNAISIKDEGSNFDLWIKTNLGFFLSTLFGLILFLLIIIGVIVLFILRRKKNKDIKINQQNHSYSQIRNSEDDNI